MKPDFAPAWLQQAGRVWVHLDRIAGQTITTGTLTAISWDTEVDDDDGFITVTASTLTVPSGLDGLYIGFVRVNWSGVGWTGRHVIDFVTGGVTYRSATTFTGESATTHAFGPLPIAAAATIVVSAFHTAGANRDLTGSLYLTRIGA